MDTDKAKDSKEGIIERRANDVIDDLMHGRIMPRQVDAIRDATDTAKRIDTLGRAIRKNR